MNAKYNVGIAYFSGRILKFKCLTKTLIIDIHKRNFLAKTTHGGTESLNIILHWYMQTKIQPYPPHKKKCFFFAWKPECQEFEAQLTEGTSISTYFNHIKTLIRGINT